MYIYEHGPVNSDLRKLRLIIVENKRLRQTSDMFGRSWGLWHILPAPLSIITSEKTGDTPLTVSGPDSRFQPENFHELETRILRCRAMFSCLLRPQPQSTGALYLTVTFRKDESIMYEPG
jgi:hypothetical protein